MAWEHCNLASQFPGDISPNSIAIPNFSRKILLAFDKAGLFQLIGTFVFSSFSQDLCRFFCNLISQTEFLAFCSLFLILQTEAHYGKFSLLSPLLSTLPSNTATKTWNYQTLGAFELSIGNMALKYYLTRIKHDQIHNSETFP